MSDLRCPGCHLDLSTADGVVGPMTACPRCGNPVGASAPEVNPYAPPLASLEPDANDLDVDPVERTTVFQKFGEAFRLLASELHVIAPLVLIVWLPANLLANYLAYHSQVEDNPFASMRLNNFVDGVFGPVYTGGLLHVLARRKLGRRASFREAIGVGLGNWGRLFGARFFTGFMILLGCLAFLVPGVMLAARYALVDPVVILEGADGPVARGRSTQLTAGQRWQIFGAWMLFFLIFLPASFGAGMLTDFFEPLQNMWVSTALDSCSDLLSMLLPIVMFLFYWEAAHREDVPAHH